MGEAGRLVEIESSRDLKLWWWVKQRHVPHQAHLIMCLSLYEELNGVEELGMKSAAQGS